MSGQYIGDIDGDGEIINADLILISKYVAGLIDLNPVEFACADIDGDGVVDNADLILLARVLLPA